MSSTIDPTPPTNEKDLNLTELEPEASQAVPQQPTVVPTERPYNREEAQEGTRGDLARGLLWLLTMTIGGIILFVALGRLDGVSLTQSVFPSLVTLAGTALGFYFGSQTGGQNANEKPGGSRPQNPE